MANVKLGNKAVGSIVKIKVNYKEREFIIIHQGKPSSLYDASCDGTWLLMKDCWKAQRWHSSSVNDYANSEVHGYLNSTFFSGIDEDIQARIKQVKIPYRPNSGGSGGINSGSNGLSAKIFLLSVREVGFTKNNINSYICDDGAKLAYFIEEGNTGGSGCQKRIAYFDGKTVNWWLRSPFLDEAAEAWYVVSNGYANASSCHYTGYYLRPALILPSSLLVSDDGTINTNTAPTTPGSINIPKTIRGGSAVTVQWGAATDAENNLEGYVVERSIDGGSSWTQIYQGGSRSTKNTVAFGTRSVMYRVKAYDSKGLQSDWCTSTQVTVINNTSPGVSEKLNIPDTVVGGKTLSVTWSEASDTDGNLAGYILERQVNGGAWEQLYIGPDTSFVDNIVKGWQTVAYRVKSYDSYDDFSDYTTSSTRTVNNNTPPAISGQDTALGLKTGCFSQTYTVSDAENNPLTITEYADDQVIRSYQVTLEQEGTIVLSHEKWLTLANGEHQLRVEVFDGIATASRVWTFSKKETVICFRLAAPRETDEAAAKILVSPTWKIEGATAKVEACNNAFDTAPAWEDITAMITLNRAYNFTNKSRTADKWGLDIRFTIEKDEDYDSEVYITGFGVAYE